MKKWFFTLTLLFSFTLSQSNLQAQMFSDNPLMMNSFSTNESSLINTESVPNEYLAVKLEQIKGFDPQSMDKMQTALHVLEQVVNSEEFKNRIINFKNTKGERAFASNKGLSNEQIYEVFMEGRETLLPNTPNEMNFYLSLYNSRWSRVIGYTDPSTSVISINWKYFKNFTPSDVAGNLAHEWTHKIGFDHKSASERDSVPYAIGYIVVELAQNYLKTNSMR
ncbi:MAG: hypothetical protein AB7I27_00695 [Bacteriovoracaceae bacterium]